MPQQWEATYFNWMDNIQPWCISRQLWWGHQIPAWYGWALDNDGQLSIAKTEVFVAETEAEALQRAKNYYKKDVELVGSMDESLAKVGLGGKPPAKVPVWRDEDVLDTWFSSALWPFSTLGWPYETAELKRYYPTNVLVDRLRHHLLLGRAHDDDGPSLHEGGAVPHRLHPCPRAATSAGRRCRSRRATSSTRST